MEAWHQLIAQGVLDAIASSTVWASDRAILAFDSFTSSVGVSDLWPVSAVILLHYLAHLKERGLSPRAMRVHLSAILLR